MTRSSGLLIAYDAECRPCCRAVERLQARDRWGLLVCFPLQNRELVQLAPELAGRQLHGDVHGVDLATRRVWTGADLLRPAMACLPGWRWVAPLLALPGLSGLLGLIWRRQAERRLAKFGRQPFQDRFR